MKILLLAGGFAKRLHPITLQKAKPLLPLGSRSVISRILSSVDAVHEIFVSTNAFFAPAFEEWKALHPEYKITVFVEDAFSEETKKGSLGAVSLFLEKNDLQDDLLILGGDNVFSFSIDDFISRAGVDPMLAVYDVKSLEEAKKYGVAVAEGESLIDFEEKPQAPRSTLVATCCFYVPQTAFGLLHELAAKTPDRLGGMFEHFLKNGLTPKVYTFDGYWNDIGTMNAYMDAHKRVADQDVPAELFDDSLGNVFEGVNHVHATAKVERSHLKNCIVLAGARVSDARLEDCVVNANAVIEGGAKQGEVVHTEK